LVKLFPIGFGHWVSLVSGTLGGLLKGHKTPTKVKVGNLISESIRDLVRSPGDVKAEIARCLDEEEMSAAASILITECLLRGWQYGDGAKCQLRGTM